METYQSSSGPNKTFVFILGAIIGASALGAGLFLYANFFSAKEDPNREFSVAPTKEFALSINDPADGDTISEDSVKISGGTGVPAVVVINGGKDDVIVESLNGSFSVEYPLVLGENQISVTAYDEATGESRTQVLDLLYLNEDLESL